VTVATRQGLDRQRDNWDSHAVDLARGGAPRIDHGESISRHLGRTATTRMAVGRSTAAGGCSAHQHCVGDRPHDARGEAESEARHPGAHRRTAAHGHGDIANGVANLGEVRAFRDLANDARSANAPSHHNSGQLHFHGWSDATAAGPVAATRGAGGRYEIAVAVARLDATTLLIAPARSWPTDYCNQAGHVSSDRT
jgi:hypothetical protein